ncbi:HU family DNA-binding protein [Bacteroides acidifaciens]|uniref:HU family DNA-binding protein n=1 Tax=Bacteroides acidifaciens TaxID=85831 RepID=UPI0025879C8A|nr:HU family DNA-binding protein [Bacteroides acidifaciens]
MPIIVVLLHSCNFSAKLQLYQNTVNASSWRQIQIAKTTGVDKAAVVTVIEQFMTVVKDSLAHGENVYLRGFGSFIVKQRAEKTARNISKNTTILIPAHNIPAFKPAKVFLEEVAK